MMKQISERALVARVNRVLSKEGQQIFTCRQNSRWYFEIGTYYIKYLKKIHSQYMALSISTRWLPSWVLVHAWSNLPHTRVAALWEKPGLLRRVFHVWAGPDGAKLCTAVCKQSVNHVQIQKTKRPAIV